MLGLLLCAYIFLIVEEGRTACRILVGEFEGNRSLGKPWHRWKDNTKVGTIKVGRDLKDWTYLLRMGLVAYLSEHGIVLQVP